MLVLKKEGVFMVIYTKKLYFFLGLLSCLLFTAGGVYLVFGMGDFFGYFVILFFGILGIPAYICMLIMPPKMILAFSEKGFSYLNVLDVSWDNVKNLCLKEFIGKPFNFNKKYIAVNTYNPISTSKLCKALHGCDCAIVLLATGANINEVYKEMNKYLSEYKAKSNHE